MVKSTYEIDYELPQVLLMQDTGIGTSEFAARTAYNSFENSENESVKHLNEYIKNEGVENIDTKLLNEINDLDSSNILNDLAWTYFHHSVLEHAVLTFLVKDISRGVLQELARHRIASYTVRSTRYTMSSVINTFIACVYANKISTEWSTFYAEIQKLNLFVTVDEEYNKIQIKDIFDKLMYQKNKMGDEEFLKISLPKSALTYFENIENYKSHELLELLEKGKKKRNVGDAFKHIVNDNWKVDLVCSFNVRSLKNFYGLRDAGSAWFQIRWLALEMKKATPKKYLSLIYKDVK